MKRKLDKQEKELIEKGITNRKAKIKEMHKELSYLEAFNKFNDEWKDYLEEKRTKDRQRKEKLITQTHKALKEQLDWEIKALSNEKKQLKNGVEVKELPNMIK